MSRSSRVIFVVAIGAAFVASGARPAGALLTRNETQCSAKATITDRKGAVVSQPDQDTREIKVPHEGRVTWEAGVAKKATDYSGGFALDLDLFTVEPSDWTFEGGPQRFVRNHGVADIPRVMKYLPPGKYKVTGFRVGDGLRCEGYAIVDVQGTPFTNPVGIGILAATVIAGIAFVRTSTARIP